MEILHEAALPRHSLRRRLFRSAGSPALEISASFGRLDPVASAPLACSGVTTYSALKKLGSIIRDEPVLMIGAGGLGLMCVSILKAMGGKGAVVVDIDERHRDAAIAAGAIIAIDGAGPDALKRIAAAFSGPCKAAIDLVGRPLNSSAGFRLACQ